MKHPETMLVTRIADGLEHLINVDDFDATIHAMIGDVVKPAKNTRAALKASTAVVAPVPVPNDPNGVPPANTTPPEGNQDGDNGGQGAAADGDDGAGDGSDGESTNNAPEGVQRVVTKIGSKYFVTDVNGNKIVAANIEPKGYKTDGEAWTAALATVA